MCSQEKILSLVPSILEDTQELQDLNDASLNQHITPLNQTTQLWFEFEQATPLLHEILPDLSVEPTLNIAVRKESIIDMPDQILSQEPKDKAIEGIFDD